MKKMIVDHADKKVFDYAYNLTHGNLSAMQKISDHINTTVDALRSSSFRASAFANLKILADAIGICIPALIVWRYLTR